jgi:dihydrofolate reductase
MRKIILYIASSLDGYIARENGDIDWLPENTASGYDEFYKTIDMVVMGKKTYEQVLTFGAYPYKDKKSYVFTRNNDPPKDKNTEFVSDVDKFVKENMSNPGKNIWLVGGSEIISPFLNRGFVDEIILSIIPVILGNGKTTVYDKLVELHYRVTKS